LNSFKKTRQFPLATYLNLTTTVAAGTRTYYPSHNRSLIYHLYYCRRK